MKRFSIIILVVLLIPAAIFAWEGKVVGVTDGDTIKVMQDGEQVKIRLAAIKWKLLSAFCN